ncbi:MAG TPA: exodeoxyribonuclease VII large subunit, partial [Acidimicrobiales bacterium]|nr:exodeoxyribonuclease VII large subunit [Acidimicrobiales bacterium]
RLAEATRRLELVDRDRAVTAGVQRAGERLSRAAGRLDLVHPSGRVAPAAARLAAAAREMEALSPVRVLERGYAVVRRASDGSVLRSAEDVTSGDALDVQLATGTLAAAVTEVRA